MRCRKVRSFLSTYCKGELTPEESARIKSHLDGCSSCRREEEAYRSINQMVVNLPGMSVSNDFTAKLFQRIGQEGFAERKTRAFLPGRIPRFGIARLAAAASVAVLILAVGIGVNLGDGFLRPSPPQMASVVSAADIGTDDDLYLTVQPTDNPLLNEHKSVSRMIQQYNRWRELSRSLRPNAAAEQFLGGGNVTMASARSGSFTDGSGIRVRPVVRNYIIIP